MPITTPWETAAVDIPGILGDGEASARVRRADDTVLFHASVLFGTSSAWLAGSFGLGLPVVAAPLWAPAQSLNTRYFAAGSAYARDVSAGASYAGSVGISGVGADPTDLVVQFRVCFSTGILNTTVPFTWDAGDVLTFSGQIEAFGN